MRVVSECLCAMLTELSLVCDSCWVLFLGEGGLYHVVVVGS